VSSNFRIFLVGVLEFPFVGVLEFIARIYRIYIAIQEARDGSPAEWLEKVTDEQYFSEVVPD